LGRRQTAITQCVRKQNAYGNLMMIIGHLQGWKMAMAMPGSSLQLE